MDGWMDGWKKKEEKKKRTMHFGHKSVEYCLHYPMSDSRIRANLRRRRAFQCATFSIRNSIFCSDSHCKKRENKKREEISLVIGKIRDFAMGRKVKGSSLKEGGRERLTMVPHTTHFPHQHLPPLSVANDPPYHPNTPIR